MGRGEEHMKFFLGALFGTALTWGFGVFQEDAYKIHIESYQMGMKHALQTNPVSWELEETCISIWSGKEMK
jgi:hypothetical protein